MAIAITVEVPNELAPQLSQFRERIPEIIERGLRELAAEQATSFQDERQIIELLTSQPSPEQVLALQPSPEFQARVSELLTRSKASSLSTVEEVELDRYLTLEHWVRMAKANAYQKLTSS
jgi:hypothetical protein